MYVYRASRNECSLEILKESEVENILFAGVISIKHIFEYVTFAIVLKAVVTKTHCVLEKSIIVCTLTPSLAKNRTIIRCATDVWTSCSLMALLSSERRGATV